MKLIIYNMQPEVKLEAWKILSISFVTFTLKYAGYSELHMFGKRVTLLTVRIIQECP